MNRTKTTLTLLVPLLFFALCITNTSVADQELIKIVSSLPKTGSANGQAQSIANGIRLAIEDVGGVVGKYKIVYEDWDDASPERGQWDPALEAANADKAISDPDVMAYIGTYNSGAAKISMPKLNQASLVMVSPANTWPGLTKPGIGEANEPDIYRPTGKVTYFRVVPADDIQGYVGAKWATDLGLKKVFILHDRELYGKGIAEMFKRSAKEFGLEVLGYEGVDPKASNYRSLATKIRQKQPELVYYGGTTQTNAGQIAKDLRSSGVTAKYMVPDGCFEKSFIESAGKENLEDTTLITFGGVPTSQLTGKGKVFYQRYKEKFNSEPEGYAAYGYDSGKVVIEAIRKAGIKNREAILEAVSQTKNFEGALGLWSFDKNGDTNLRTMSGNAVKSGEFVFVKLLG